MPPRPYRTADGTNPGGFGGKRFLVRLEEFIADKPYDVVNLSLEVPTFKGARLKTPSYMTFEITRLPTSTDGRGIPNRCRRGLEPRRWHTDPDTGPDLRC